MYGFVFITANSLPGLVGSWQDTGQAVHLLMLQAQWGSSAVLSKSGPHRNPLPGGTSHWGRAEYAVRRKYTHLHSGKSLRPVYFPSVWYGRRIFMVNISYPLPGSKIYNQRRTIINFVRFHQHGDAALYSRGVLDFYNADSAVGGNAVMPEICRIRINRV